MKAPPPPFLFRIVGKSDGMTVTLGRYHSRAEADLDHARLIQQSQYRDVIIQELAPPPPPPAEPAQR